MNRPDRVRAVAEEMARVRRMPHPEDVLRFLDLADAAVTVLDRAAMVPTDTADVVALVQAVADERDTYRLRSEAMSLRVGELEAQSCA